MSRRRSRTPWEKPTAGGVAPATRTDFILRGWEGEDAVATFLPEEFHAAGPRHVLNGGIIATLIDCHSVCTAIAAAYRAENRPMGAAPSLWYATASLNVSYLRPTPLERGLPVVLRARVVETAGKKTRVTCSLFAREVECARGEVLAVRVSDAWRSKR